MHLSSPLGFSRHLLLPSLAGVIIAACGGSSDSSVIGQGAGSAIGGSTGSTSTGSTSTGSTSTGSTSTSTGSTSTSTSTSTSSTSSSSGSPTTCKADADCAADKNHPVCDTMTSLCVGCAAGTTASCYDGPAGTAGIGACVAGSHTCDANGSWGACAGEVVPVTELCSNGLDDNCNGMVDEATDADKDGWTTCDGDCNDADPTVNPGAYENLNDAIDNDCDPSSSDSVPVPACSGAAKYAAVSALDVAQAIDICQTTTANAPLPMKKWGLITADSALLNADGSVPNAADLGNIQNNQTAILTDYGTGGIVPKMGPTFAGISSGMMRDEDDPGNIPPIGGGNYSWTSSFSPTPGAPLGTYTSAHANTLLPGTCGGMSCTTGTNANDSVDVKLSIRVPTNAKSMSYDFRFFSAEYQTYQCTTFNDYYLAMFQSAAPGIPADHNISFDALNNPVSVNNGFFQVCAGNGKNCGNCPAGAGELAGTGLEVSGGLYNENGGGTTWLTTDAPVVPGETMVIEFVIFDVGDHAFDSYTILDNFRWSLTPSVVGTHQ